MNLVQTKNQLSEELSTFKKEGKTIGLVPTMGALHDGHATLVKQAIIETDVVVISIFVNPTQFNNNDDLKNYPRTLAEDMIFLGSISKDIIVFAPKIEDIYSEQTKSDSFDFKGLDTYMEGQHRAGHFDGVATIVKKLLELVKPHKAYFGEKDFQQLAIVRRLVDICKMPVTIVAVPIHREKDGLAMSSRNVRLSESNRTAAPLIFKLLQDAKTKFGIENAKSITEWVEDQFRNNENLELEYFVIADAATLKPINIKKQNTKYRAFIAAYADDVRLIDNIALN